MSAQAEGVSLPPAEKAALRQLMEYDPWVFSLFVCGRNPKAEKHHRPLLYLYTRRVELLCATLDDPKFDGPITQQIREDFQRQEPPIDWRNPAQLPRVAARLRRINIRMPRSSGKSTFADDADFWLGSVDPDVTISIGSKSAEFAVKRITTIGMFVLSPAYAFWFPERVPDDPQHEVTEDSIWLKGRTRHVPEATIEGRGLLGQWAGTHYRVNRRDDIVGTESGQASVEDALKHLANLSALRDHTGWIGDTIIGTINGDEDDHTMLASDPTVLSVVVPMEEHEGGTTLDNVYEDGVLLMPEWFDRDQVTLIKAEAKANPKYGAIWLLQNFYMAAHKTGTSIFNAKMIERAKFRWVFSERLKRHVIVRPKKGFEKIPVDRLAPDQLFVLDLKTLPKTAFATGIDQSVSEDGSRDKWAQVLVCVDWEGVYYALDSVAEHGYSNLLDQLIPFDQRKGDRSSLEETRLCDRPQYIGVDSNATQGMTVEWLKRSEEFRSIERRVVPVTSNNEKKDMNIRTWLQARMLTGDFYVNPKLHDYITTMLKYRPYANDGRRRRNPIDDELDATWMAMTLPRVPPSPEVIEEEELLGAMRRMEEMRHLDPMTGMNTDQWFDANLFGRVA